MRYAYGIFCYGFHVLPAVTVMVTVCWDKTTLVVLYKGANFFCRILLCRFSIL
jgi:hypothetical protein